MRFFRCFLLLLLAGTLRAQQVNPGANDSFQISGKVVGAISRTAIPNCTVVIEPVTQRSRFQRTQTRSDGSFSFDKLGPGKYSLIAVTRGYPQQYYQEHEGFNTGIAVGEGKTSTGIVFFLQPEGSISGGVTDEHNEAVRHAQVMLFEKQAATGRSSIVRQRQAQTNDLGEYRFHHLRAGTYYLVVQAQPWFRQYIPISRPQQFTFTTVRDPDGTLRQERREVPQPPPDPQLNIAYPLTYYPNATDESGAGALVLHPGDRLRADFSMTPITPLHVIVHHVFPEGNPQNNGAVNFRQEAFGEPLFAHVQWMPKEGGDLEAVGLPPGRYSLDIQPRNNGGAQREDGRAQEITITDNGEVDANEASAVPTITGTATFGGFPSVRIPVTLELRDPKSPRALASAQMKDGKFELHARKRGDYLVVLASNAYFIKSLSAIGATLDGRLLHLTGEGPVTLTVTAATGTSIINGTASKNSKPIGGAMVLLVPSDIEGEQPLFRRDQSDSDGTFTLPGVLPGKYTLLVIANGWDLEWANPDVLAPYLKKGTNVLVEPNHKYDFEVAAQ
jgi:hypothetical protein